MRKLKRVKGSIEFAAVAAVGHEVGPARLVLLSRLAPSSSGRWLTKTRTGRKNERKGVASIPCQEGKPSCARGQRNEGAWFGHTSGIAGGKNERRPELVMQGAKAPERRCFAAVFDF